MIKLHIQNLDKIDKKHGLEIQDMTDSTAKQELESIQKSLKNKKIDLHQNIEKYTHIKDIKKLSAKLKNKYKHILIIGMGGSSLGTIFLINSLLHLQHNNKQINKNDPKETPTIYILDHIDPDSISETLETINITQTLTITISKSGGTLETIAIYQHVKTIAQQAGENYKQNFIFITEDDSKLSAYAKKESQQTLPIPKEIGGRFSILTPVSLFPAELLNINIDQITQSSQKYAEKLKTSDPTENIAYQFAKIQYDLFKKGKTINIIWPYSQKLKELSNWYRQLLAESIGKKLNNNNEEIFAGITPVLALETTDQHSQTQLYNEGPNNNLIVFIKTKHKNTIIIKNQEQRDLELLNIENKTLNEIIDISQTATASALTANNRPNITIEIDKINEQTVGELIIFFETSIIYLGEMLEINTFNQPGVELAKTLIKAKLNI